jgi:uncharacterized protein YegP (UPF0339 family)
MGTFVITKRFNDEYKFEYVSRKGKTIVTSDSYELKFECEEAIELLKESLLTCVFLRFKTSKGKCFFRVMIGEKSMAVSRRYTTELLMQKGIAEIIKYAAQSEVLDFSNNDSIFAD